jgi:hypothetical protein
MPFATLTEMVRFNGRLLQNPDYAQSPYRGIPDVETPRKYV